MPSLYRAAAARVVYVALDAVRARGRFKIALSGGNTPQALFTLLASPALREAMPWQDTLFFWGDERCVPPDQAESNYFQAKETMFTRAPVMAENIHRVRGELSPEAACQDYLMTLRRHADRELSFPIFDLVLLGLGSDGHTAALFPDARSEIEQTHAALAVEANYQGRPASRVTLTPLTFNAARNIMFLVSGSAKAAAVARTLQGPHDPARAPAQMICPNDSTVAWFMDHSAAGALAHAQA